MDEERTRSQPFEVDLDIETDLSEAGKSDALESTVDYGPIAGSVVGLIQEESHMLLERLAERVSETVLDDDRVKSVVVSVRKLQPSMPVDIDTVGVRVVRSKP